MGKLKYFKVRADRIRGVIGDKSSPDRTELDDILAKGASPDGHLTPAEINKLVNGAGAANFPEIAERVISVASDVRKSIFDGHVVVMAPIEVGNICASNCDFCGWKSSNKEMERARVPQEMVLEQANYLIKKGIYSIELVGGDDPVMVRDIFPTLIPEIRKLFPPDVKGRIQICTMALTKNQYKNLKESGADGIIVWQETYDRDVYKKHIHSGPKAHGINDDWTVDEQSDGFTFRLRSQERALEMGLDVALGSMLGLNPNLNFEILATILHARHLIESGVSEEKPLIVGMPTWNKITTPKTDMRPREYKDPTAFFPYIAAIYLLSLDKKKAWIFPNCRVPIETQIEALKAGGVFTSTEVKLGPAGYMPQVLAAAREMNDHTAVDKITRMISEHLGRDFEDLGQLQAYLDQREQFCHYYYPHKHYKLKFHEAGLHVAPETFIKPDRTLERMEELTIRRVSQRFARDFFDRYINKKKVNGT